MLCNCTGFNSFNNSFPTQLYKFQMPLSNFNLFSSNNCVLKLFWTFGVATIIILFEEPMPL